MLIKTKILIFTLLLLSCATKNYHSIYYKKNVDVQHIPQVEKLSKGKDPDIYTSNNFDKDYSILLSKGYILLGYSNFQGELDPKYNVIQVGREKGASVILTSNSFLGTNISTIPLLLPTSSTTYHNGNFSGSSQSTYYNQYGNQIGQSNGGYTGNYSGSSSTQGNQWVPITSSKNIYRQTTAFFVKSNQKLKFGAYYRDLTPEERQEKGRNTGVRVTIVVEDTPAFKLNLITGDIIISINDHEISNTQSLNTIIHKSNHINSISVRRGNDYVSLSSSNTRDRKISSKSEN